MLSVPCNLSEWQAQTHPPSEEFVLNLLIPHNYLTLGRLKRARGNGLPGMAIALPIFNMDVS